MIRMPWTEACVPNVMLEVTGACNIACRACYRHRTDRLKTVDELRRELEHAAALRPLHTVTLSGGEPTLHPDLCEIVAMVTAAGFHCFLLTNGTRLDTVYAGRLAAAGLDSLLLHVDPGQERPDLPNPPSIQDAIGLLRKLTRLVRDAGIEPAVSATLYEDWRAVLPPLTAFVLHETDPTFLFISRGIESGALRHGLRPRSPAYPTLPAVADFFADTYGIRPFAYVPSLLDGTPRLISMLAPVVAGNGAPHLFPYRSNRLDRYAMELIRRVTGRYPHKMRQSAPVTLLRTILNGVSTGQFTALAGFLRAAAGRPGGIRHKVIVYDDGPDLTSNGALDRCAYCLTPVYRDGAIVPCCVAHGPDVGGIPT